MFFEKVEQIPKLAGRAGTVIFAVEPEVKVKIPGAIVIEPEDGKKITVEQVREVVRMTQSQETQAKYFVFKQAETLREEAENALLKLLEEPKENYHFVLLTKDPGSLLPTIRSRAEIYYPRVEQQISQPPRVKKEVLEMAKKLLATRAPRDYLEIAEAVHKKKDEREYALVVLATAIELAYKSFLMTGKRQFLAKIPQLIETHQNIKNNGNVRLHLVADLC